MGHPFSVYRPPHLTTTTHFDPALHLNNASESHGQTDGLTSADDTSPLCDTSCARVGTADSGLNAPKKILSWSLRQPELCSRVLLPESEWKEKSSGTWRLGYSTIHELLQVSDSTKSFPYKVELRKPQVPKIRLGHTPMAVRKLGWRLRSGLPITFTSVR